MLAPVAGREDLQCITDHDCIPVEKVERMKVHLLWKKSLKVHRQLFQLSMHLNHHVEIYEFLCILHPKFSKKLQNVKLLKQKVHIQNYYAIINNKRSLVILKV